MATVNTYPITEPNTKFSKAQKYERLNIKAGSYHAQGFRPTMEDAAVACYLKCYKSTCLTCDENNPVQFYAIFDGHAGSQCANWLKRNLPIVMTKFLNVEKDVETAIKHAFKYADDVLIAQKCTSGSTCVALLIEEKTNFAWTINLGDSRVLLSNGFSSVDQTPQSDAKRIMKEGGFIANDRVCGVLGVARAFGDSLLKPFVGWEPDIVKHQFSSATKYVVLACDGLWDVMSNELVGRLCQQCLDLDISPSLICKQLVESSINHFCSQDNVSALLLSIQSC